MDIGSRMKNARVQADLTQEKVAEALGISRQTLSNWENEKTYPDIKSVVKISDLYAVSLDYLLKGEEEGNTVSDYLNYLEESTNVVKSKNKLSKVILVMAYLVIWSVALIAFWFFNEDGDAMGYALMYLWFLLPVTTLVLSIIIGRNDYWEEYKWISALAFGIMYMLAEYATFSMANMIAFDKINLPDFKLIIYGAIVSLIGLAIGSAVHQHKEKAN